MKAISGAVILCLLFIVAVRVGSDFAKGQMSIGDGAPYEILRRSEEPILFWLFVALTYVVLFTVAAAVFSGMILPALRD